MKKILVFAAMAATLTLVSCNQKPGIEIPSNAKQELSINTVALTKGYVEGADFLDTPYDKLHDASAVKADRALNMSAYVTPQSGEAGNYFVAEPFTKNANGETDNLWHHAPKVYWPLGGTLDFLAYSCTKSFPGTAVKWDESNAASKLVLDVPEDFLQDDLLYGAVAGRQTNDGASVAMVFNHTQAWIQFQIKVKEASMENVVKVKDIMIENLYTRGELTITGGATPDAQWNFKKETAIDYPMDDTNAILSPAFIGSTVGYMDMLVPEQAQTKFVMHYTLAGSDNVLEYSYDLAAAQWQKGKKYIYEIVFAPYEITVTPSVTAFVDVNPGATGFPSELQ